MRSAVHHSHETDSYQAGRQAVFEVVQQLSDIQPDVLFLFSSIGHDLPKLMAGVHSLAPEVSICGCTGAGLISGGGSDEATHSVVLMGLVSDKIRIIPFSYTNLSLDPEGVGERIASLVSGANIAPGERSLMILFADGLTVNADGLYRGLTGGLSDHIDVVGGTAGNDFQQQVTYQFCNGRVMTDAVCGVLLYGQFEYHVGVTHGSRPVGLFRTITRARGNLICEIDNQPALDILKEFIGAKRVQDVGLTLNLFELGEEFPGQGYSDDIINRAIIGVDEKQGGIRLAVEIAEGTKVRITRRDMELVLQRTREMTEAMVDWTRDPEKTAYLYFNCSGRGSYLFGDPEQDVDVVRGVLPAAANLGGFFTFGEFAPVNNRNYFHNYTGVLVGIAP